MLKSTLNWTHPVQLSAGTSWATITAGDRRLLTARGHRELDHFNRSLQALLFATDPGDSVALNGPVKGRVEKDWRLISLTWDREEAFVERADLHDLCCWLSHTTGTEGPRPSAGEARLTETDRGVLLSLDDTRGHLLNRGTMADLVELLQFLCQAGPAQKGKTLPHLGDGQSCRLDCGDTTIAFTVNRNGYLVESTNNPRTSMTRCGMAILAERIVALLD